jgi:protein-S-isoprenylcysteine O-methyltransferase Ste14
LNRIALNICSITGFFLMLTGMMALISNRGLFSPHPALITVQGAAVVFLIWARRTFGLRSFHLAANPTAGGLVTSGPYRYVRHPIYASALALTWAGIAGNWSAPNVFFGIMVIGGAFLRILCEEHLVRIRYPEYDAYAAKTKRLIPFLF